MNSKLFTVLLVVGAILFGTLAGVQFAQDDLSSFFGAPPRKTGDVLYQFNVRDVALVNLTSGSGEQAVFKKDAGAWFMTSPVLDRADYRDLQRLVFFSRHLRIEDVLRREDTSLEETGMREVGTRAGRVKVELRDSSGNLVAEYRLGRRTGWHHQDEESGETSETFFIRPNERSQKDYIYVCSTPDTMRPNIRQILDEGLHNLRDHRPFLFDSGLLADLTIKKNGGELVLSREAFGYPFQLTKPLASRTEPNAVESLLKGLYGLEATAIHESGEVTIPPRPTSTPYLEVILRFFDRTGNVRPDSTVLTVEPPATEGANSVYAMVSDRPGTIFELPLKAGDEGVALPQLPLTVDELRSRTLASIKIEDLRAIALYERNLTRPIILTLGRERMSRRPRWMVAADGKSEPANEAAIAELLHSIGEEEVLGYEDAAGDPAQYGLAPPSRRLVLRFSVDGEMKDLDLRFGRSSEGQFFARQEGVSSVTEIGGATFASLVPSPYHWQDTLLLPVSIIDLEAMRVERTVKIPIADPALTLKYDYLDESWTARQFGEDATARLIMQRANKFIRALEELRVTRWLGPEAANAALALETPVFRLTAAFRQTDEEGNAAGLKEISIEIAKVSRSRANRNYYGRLSGVRNAGYFLIDESVEALAVPLVEED